MLSTVPSLAHTTITSRRLLAPLTILELPCLVLHVRLMMVAWPPFGQLTMMAIFQMLPFATKLECEDKKTCCWTVDPN